MGFKANIDIALSFSTLKICSVRQQGRIKFRICLYYTFPTGKKVTDLLHSKKFINKNLIIVILTAY